MSKAEQKVTQYLDEAHASEKALARVLQSQILVAPAGSYRRSLESHLGETREHARRLERRLQELGEGGDSLLLKPIGAFESAVGQLLALGKAPLDMVRGTGGEEVVLKNAKDAYASEALEIATYTALERLARSVGDDQTAALAASIRGEEEKMASRILAEIPRLTEAVVGSDVRGNGSYELSDTGAAEALREAGTAARETVGGAEKLARKAARKARKVPGVAQAEGQIKGAVASEGDLAISGYDGLTAAEVTDRLPDLSQIELAKVDSYERRHDNRTTVLSRLATLRSQEPWPGYDELNVSEIRGLLSAGDERLARTVLSYERSHKQRSGIIESAQRERASA